MTDEELRALIDDRRAKGWSDVRIAQWLRRLADLALEESLGLIERVTLPDGSALIYERDPFEKLPTTSSGDV